jgi:hypothetical protein
MIKNVLYKINSLPNGNPNKNLLQHTGPVLKCSWHTREYTVQSAKGYSNVETRHMQRIAADCCPSKGANTLHGQDVAWV